MEGIFGVGLGEILVVALVLFIVGGPKNTARWARETGRMVRKVRQMWAQVLADLEKEIGPEGKELMDVTRELTHGANDIRKMSPAKRLVGETLKMVEDATDIKQAEDVPPTTAPATPPSENGKSASGTDKKYQAWLPPEEK